MQPMKSEDEILDKELDEICEGFREAIDREVEGLRRDGFPIYVAENGTVVDLQTSAPIDPSFR